MGEEGAGPAGVVKFWKKHPRSSQSSTNKLDTRAESSAVATFRQQLQMGKEGGVSDPHNQNYYHDAAFWDS